MNARCPHLILRDVLGSAAVASLLEYAVAREPDFRPALAYDRRSGERSIDTGRRDCMLLDDLGPFLEPVAAFVRSIVGPSLTQLRIDEPAGEPREFEISAYGDGGHFGAHVDTVETLRRVRVLSCVYYFSATPRRFGGGELRLYGLPALPGKETAGPAFVDVAPETNSFVVFPSWMRHEVLPVEAASVGWAGRRFAVNCWIHRGASEGERS
jgi:SM-20-related protein